MPDARTAAIQAAARAHLEHGGRECRTDPHIPINAANAALDLGATVEDIQAEMARQRNQN